MLDIESIRKEFPILAREVHGKPLVYFDNGATTQKPQCVLDRIMRSYMLENSNIHRGVHYLSGVATEAHEAARQRVADFIGANSKDEILFTRGTTESINLVARVNKHGGNAKLTLYEGAGHDAWTPAYKTKELYEWMLSHTASENRKEKIDDGLKGAKFG